MRKTHDIVATVGEYTDRQTGEKKKRRVNIGAAFIDDQGHQCIKLETIPVGPNWSGFANLYEVDRDRQSTQRQERPTRPATQQRQRPAPPPAKPEGADETWIDDEADQDIPF